MVDGTFWQDDEMILAAYPPKKQRAWAICRKAIPGGMIEALKGLARGEAHPGFTSTIPTPNSSNPGRERALLDACGIEVAFDGMEIRL